MVSADVLAGPYALRGPVGRGTRPEFIGRGKTKGKQSGRAEIETSGGNIIFGHRWLRAAETDGEKAVLIECTGRFDHFFDDRGEGGLNLCRGKMGWQVFAERHLGE